MGNNLGNIRFKQGDSDKELFVRNVMLEMSIRHWGKGVK